MAIFQKTDVLSEHSIGNIIAKGEQIAEIGSQYENGNWAPHLHFQVNVINT